MGVRVQPDTKFTAEVVVLLTTLGAKRTEYNAGKRARDLLEIKRVHHKVIDFNRDARQAGNGEAENKAVQKLMSDNKLKVGDDGDLVLPQIFLDGIYTGNADSLQAFEDDGDLEEMLLWQKCIACGKARAPDTKNCKACGTEFEEILPDMMTIEEHLAELSYYYDKDDDYD